METYAAIDIGSNAVRLLISGIFPEDPGSYPKQIAWVRLPMRLGADTYADGRISEIRARRFEQVMEGFSMIMAAYEPCATMACATAAIRNAENGTEICERIQEKTGISIEIIDGAREAAIQFSTQKDVFADGSSIICVDVGGGSTEISVFCNGNIADSRSFDLGAIRLLNPTSETRQVWKDMESWVRQMSSDIGTMTAVGTGGNINAAFQLAQANPDKLLSHEQLKRIYQLLEPLSVKERCVRYGLKPDRADVLTLGLDIYIKVMEWAGCGDIYVPMVGLCDGMVHMLYEHRHGISEESLRPLFAGEI